MEGAAGAKHWITRLTSYEPQSGKAYRKILKKYRGFYNVLSDIVPELKWRGCRIPVMKEACFTFGKAWNMGEDIYSGWGECVLERMGLPMYFSSENGGVLCLEGDVKLTDSEILEALKGSVLLASDSAEALINRGFEKYIGVNVRQWNGKQPVIEKLLINNNYVKCQMKIKELVPTSTEARADSFVYHTLDNKNYELLFPGTAIYKNSLGGTVYVFSGTPRTNYNITEAFSFLNYSRKEQLIHMLGQTGELPVYYPGDEEVYVRAADMPDGKLFCAFFNIGLDPIDKLEIVFDRTISKIEKLMPDGTKKEIEFRVEDDNYILNSECNTLEPVVIFAE